MQVLPQVAALTQAPPTCVQSEATITVLASDLSSPSGGSKTPSALIGGLVGGGEWHSMLHACLPQPHECGGLGCSMNQRRSGL